ncbi:MAG: transglutaminase-like domain-containing protein [Candidatus Promineifilaceae bacterium]|nr:transglutaminase-like domain-containing protein [Candidatus Promineifilaceae bacterium]
MTHSDFASIIQSQPIDLASAALQLARDVAYPGLQITAYLQRLEELTATARSQVPVSDQLGVQAELLAEHLFLRLGFRGNVESYSDPENSFLNRVLDRRLGIPISLSVLYVLVARRLEIPAFGVALPGHFVVGVQVGEQRYYFDPFHGGGRLSTADCARLVAETTGYQGPLRSEWLAPTEPKYILVRMLNNLRVTYIQRQNWPEALTVLGHLRVLDPEEAEFIRDIGLVHFRRGATVTALHWLERYLAREPEAPDAAAIRRGLKPAIDQWVRMN